MEGVEQRQSLCEDAASDEERGGGAENASGGCRDRECGVETP